MKPLRLKRLSDYVRALERAKYNIVTSKTIAQTLIGPETITLMLEHDENKDTQGQIASVTHEIIHQTHKLASNDSDLEADKQQEDEIERLAGLLMARPEWVMLVAFWLNQALTDELLTETNRMDGLDAERTE